MQGWGPEAWIALAAFLWMVGTTIIVATFRFNTRLTRIEQYVAANSREKRLEGELELLIKRFIERQSPPVVVEDIMLRIKTAHINVRERPQRLAWLKEFIDAGVTDEEQLKVLLLGRMTDDEILASTLAMDTTVSGYITFWRVCIEDAIMNGIDQLVAKLGLTRDEFDALVEIGRTRTRRA